MALDLGLPNRKGVLGGRKNRLNGLKLIGILAEFRSKTAPDETFLKSHMKSLA